MRRGRRSVVATDSHAAFQTGHGTEGGCAMDPGTWSEIFDLGRFAAPRHPDTSQGGGWTIFCPSQLVRGGFGLNIERGGVLCGRSWSVFLDETQNATEVLRRRAAQVFPGGSECAWGRRAPSGIK